MNTMVVIGEGNAMEIDGGAMEGHTKGTGIMAGSRVVGGAMLSGGANCAWSSSVVSQLGSKCLMRGSYMRKHVYNKRV